MRIAMVCPYAVDRFGGVQHQALQLADWLRADGHEVGIIAPGDDGPDGAILLGGTTSIRANGSKVPIALHPGAGRRAVAAVQGFDVVHVHEPLMPLVSLAVVFGDAPPLVGTFHADPPSWVRGSYKVMRSVLERIVGRLDAVTAVSDVAASAIAPFAEPVIVPNGLDVGLYDVATTRAPKRVAFLGRDETRKGLDVLLDAWAAVRSGHSDAELIVMGCSRPTAPAGVTFLGRVSEEAKREGLASSAIYVAPNRSGESFGIVLAEAMAAGAAVVASELPAFTAVAGAAATYVPPGDPRRLAAAIGGLLDDPHRITESADRGRERVMAFDRRVVTDAYVEQYQRAIASVGD